MTHPKSQLLLTSILLLLTASVGCNRTRKYPLQGEVIAKDAMTGEITVKHGDIPGFMSAMTMPYRVKDPSVIRELQPGDKVAAEVVVGNDPSAYWLRRFASPMNLGGSRRSRRLRRVCLCLANACPMFHSSTRMAEPSIFQILLGRRCWLRSSIRAVPCRISVPA